MTTSPCILTRHQLGENVDKDPTWRATAVFTRAELGMLISESRVPPDRQVLYALQGIAALRHGEAAGLRWKHYDPATSYDKGHTKTKRTRYMPMHPTLAAMLTEWRLQDWPEMMGRTPTPEDLVVPMPRPTNRGPRVEFGGMRTDHHSYKRLAKAAPAATATPAACARKVSSPPACPIPQATPEPACAAAAQQHSWAVSSVGRAERQLDDLPCP